MVYNVDSLKRFPHSNPKTFELTEKKFFHENDNET